MRGKIHELQQKLKQTNRCKKTFTLHDVVFAVAEHKNRIVKNLGKDGFYTKVVTKSKNFPVTAYAIYKCPKD